MKRLSTDDSLGIYSADKIKSLSKSSPWLARVMDKLLYEEIRDAISDVSKRKDFPRYNPYLYEPLMADVSRLLDRCLAYRRECADLERQAVNRALAYDLFNKMADKSEELNKEQTDTSSLDALRVGQKATGDALAKATSDFKLLGDAYSAAADAAQDAIDNQQRVAATLEAIRELQIDYQKDLQLRHDTPGHALNYAERRARVVTLIQQDIAQAYEKAYAAAAGLAHQVEVESSPDHPFPTMSGTTDDVGFLDAFVLWTRDVLSQYERYSADEVVFDLVVPIFGPYYVAGDPAGGAAAAKSLRLYGNANVDFLNQLTKASGDDAGTFGIGLEKVLPPAINAADSHVRLRGIGLSAGEDPAALDAGMSWAAVILLPDQDNPFQSRGPWRKAREAASKIPRGPVIFGKVLPYVYSSPPVINSGEEVWNATVKGDTRILILPTAVSSSGDVFVGPALRAHDKLKDLKVHLRLVAKPLSQLADWQKNPPNPKVKKLRKR